MTHEFKGHDDWIRCCEFSLPDAASWLLATASNNSIVHVWDLDAKVLEKGKDGKPTSIVPL